MLILIAWQTHSAPSPQIIPLIVTLIQYLTLPVFEDFIQHNIIVRIIKSNRQHIHIGTIIIYVHTCGKRNIAYIPNITR